MTRTFALPGSQPQYAPDRRFDIQHYRICIDIDTDNASVSGSCRIEMIPLAEGHRWLILDAAEFDVHTVSRDGTELPFCNDGRKLHIDLCEQAKEGKAIALDIAYAATPRRGLCFVGPDAAYPDKPHQVWSQGQDQDSRYWFPCFDSPHEKATSEVIVTVPATWLALSNGNLADDRTNEHDRRTFHWQLDIPHSCYLITLVAGEFSVIEDTFEDIQVLYYVQPGREQACRRCLERTPEMLALFSDKFGVRYPYDKYAQVFVTDFSFGGMENTTATTLTDVVLMDERAALDYQVDDLVAHELAHQWFGDLLTCRDWSQAWLNEGFATYSEYIWREHADGPDAAAVELDAWSQRYFDEDAKRYRRHISTNIYEHPIDLFDHHLYEKAGRVVHMLRRILGEAGFWRTLRQYTRSHRMGSVETRDFARAVEQATGRVLDWFFDQWILKHAGHPELTASYAWDPEAKQARLHIKQTQTVTDDTPLFRLPMYVRFRTATGGPDIDIPIELTEQQHTFFFSFETEPVHAILDPGKHILAEVKIDKPTPLWCAQLLDAHAAIDRMHAARALADIGGHHATNALLHALGSDPFWSVQREAATALATLRTTQARDALITHVTMSHPKARRGVVAALGAFRYDQEAANALTNIVVNGDDSYFVEAQACLSLGKTRTPNASATLRTALSRNSMLDIIRQLTYRGLAETGDDSVIDELLEGSTYGKVSHGRRAALAAAATLARGRRDKLATMALERAVELLDDPDFDVRTAAIEALAVIGHPLCIDALERCSERDLDGRLKRRAREVIRDIRASNAVGEHIASLESALDTLRSQTVMLRERVDKLEAALPNSTPKPTQTTEPRRRISSRRVGGKKTAPRREGPSSS